MDDEIVAGIAADRVVVVPAGPGADFNHIMLLSMGFAALNTSGSSARVQPRSSG
jgi:hypothetical protein